jgi:hypothetical protein
MKTALSLLAVATILVAPSLSATQSNAQFVSPAVHSGIQESAGELSADVQVYLGRGDESSSRLNYGAAGRDYRRAADVARREGHLSSATSWRLATALYNDGNLVGAALALDGLANEAALVGDLEVEALSIYYSAWLNGKAGRKVETAVRVARLEGLLGSRYMPAGIRDRLGDWLKTSREVAVRR